MEKIEEMEKMRERVDKLRENDLPGEDSVYDMAIAEGKSRKEIRNSLRKEGIKRTMGSSLVGELANLQSTRILETMEVKEKVWIDELTGLRNRRAYNEVIPDDLANTYKREGKECSLLFFDLDNFKSINDTHGHGAGDTALKELANLINNAHLRESDIAYRWGGDEFAIFLSNVNLEGAKKVAGRIREIVENHIFTVTNKEKRSVELKITVSIGCSSTESHEIHREMESEEILQELERKSSSALHDAKHAGKNRVIAYGEKPKDKENS
jgi:diguanylate cyclase (GGDEF)-like protein